MINIVGGTYQEFCFEPFWEETYGSGLRACLTVLALDQTQAVYYHTFADKPRAQFLETLERQFDNLSLDINGSRLTPSFYYDHPLSTPRIHPRPDTLDKTDHKITLEGDQILLYGMIEGNATVKGKKVVYDPQSPANPQPFSSTGSTADELIIVINFSEAKAICKTDDIEGIKNFFFTYEGAYAIIIKMGPQGAYVFAKDGYNIIIPVFETNYVWPIGSGDVFAASFSYYWFSGKSLEDAAMKASLATAAYCSTRGLPSVEINSSAFKPLSITQKPSKPVYLAGPFFTFAERWLIDQIRTILLGLNVRVFSPFHDVGYGLAQDVVHKDIEAIEKSGLILAVLDGLDSGTLFEVGYAVSRKTPVVAYVQNETNDSIKMLEGTQCVIESDLSTAIYKAYWILAKNE
ncbi:PfkB family carbohydrate kinase [Larkinella sp. C7]|jgi:nucleoside 2-deoxyribosyltransferase|uniref:PfkB family carbohydrate kinase n=1 Tax=Larkinella sp. C7 TaxID=2576607 RepID=UPI00111133E6|nr:PfkB family carbohydrate kinase [Larkinella sp. C7]